MTKKIRILQSVNSLGMGGNVIFVMNFFRHIDKEKFQVDFVIYDDSKMDFYDEVVAAGSKVYVCKTNYRNKYIDTLAKTMKVKKIILENNYDIIHCHSCSFLGIFRGAIGGWLSKRAKVISHSHNPGMPKNTTIDNFIRSIFKKFLSRIVDLGFACSDVAAESKYTDKFMKSNKFFIINNAIDTDKFLFNENVRSEIRKKYNINDEFVIGNIGRLEKQKNQKLLLKVFSEVRKKEPSAKLMLVGDGSLRKELEQYALDMKIDKDVIFVGKVSDSTKYYQAMDMFVLTSIYEGFPFVMVEAQINGLPAVVSSVITKSVDISGNVEFVALENTAKRWADVILKSKKERLNLNEWPNNYMEYDLSYQTRYLEKIYMKTLKLELE